MGCENFSEKVDINTLSWAYILNHSKMLVSMEHLINTVWFGAFLIHNQMEFQGWM